MHKEIHIIAGANGAGKTTKAEFLLPRGFLSTNEFVNADNIAKGISPYNFDSKLVVRQAGRQMLIRINNLVKEQKSFAFETTLSSKGYVNLIKNCRDAGYVVNLIFLYISNPIINIGRVEDRVRNGGHNIEDSVIQRRYYRGIENLIISYLPIVDNAMLFDGSNMQFSLEEDRIMEKVNEKTIIFKPNIWENLLTISKIK